MSSNQPNVALAKTVVLAAVMTFATGSAWADETKELTADEAYHRDYIFGVPYEPSEAWLLANGGRIYDNWFNTLAQDEPRETHPAWPASNTTEGGSTTWRCKSCHGWDYKGKDGQYGTGDYATGIGGVIHMVGRSPSDVAKLLSDDNHQYTDDMIPPDARARVGLFLSRGMHDPGVHIDGSGQVLGDPERGKPIFQNVCAACHGFDGKALNWGDDGEPAFVGTEANANPWEVLHKIRNGHPGHEMVSLRTFPIEYAVDVLTYTQTLPEE